MRPWRHASALTLLLFATGPVWPQAKAAPPSVGPQPVATTATYGDWTLRCEANPGGDTAQNFCEVVQTIQLAGKQAPAAQVAFGRPDHGPALHVIAALPVNVAFPSTARVAVGDADPRPVDLEWKRCLPGACFADATATDEALGRWRAASAPGRLRYTDAANREVVLPVSFRGLAQALDAMGRR